MGKKKKKESKRRDWIETEKEPLHNPFAALQQRNPSPQTKPSSQKPSSSPDTSPTTPSPRKDEPLVVKRAVVRTTRKGRGGKTVTVVTHLGLPSDTMQTWCTELRKGLGCGGQVEDDTLVFHGDQRKRLVALLTNRGVRKITQG